MRTRNTAVGLDGVPITHNVKQSLKVGIPKRSLGTRQGIDYGFDYAAGASAAQTLTTFVNNKITNYPAPLGKALQASLSKLLKKESTVATEPLALAKQTAINYVLENGKKLAADGIEFSYAYDEFGNELLTKQGVESAVGFTNQELSALKLAKATLVHNHPDGVSLSVADFRLQNDYSLKEVVAAGHNGVVYSGHVLDRQAFETSYKKINNAVFDEFSKLTTTGKLSTADAEILHHHVVNLILTTAGIINYDALNHHLLPNIEMLNKFIKQIIADVKRIIK